MSLYDAIFPDHLNAAGSPRLHTDAAVPWNSIEPSYVSRARIESLAEAAKNEGADLVLDCEQLVIPEPFSYTSPVTKKMLNTTRLVATYATQACKSRGIKWGFYGIYIPTGISNQVNLGDTLCCFCAYHSVANEAAESVTHDWQKMVQGSYDYAISINRKPIAYVNPVYIWGDPAYYGTPVQEGLWHKSLEFLKHLGCDVAVWGVTAATDPAWGFDPAGKNMQALVRAFGAGAN